MPDAMTFVALASEPLNIPTIVEDIFTVAGKALTFVSSNPILLLFFTAPIVGLAIRVIRGLKQVTDTPKPSQFYIGQALFLKEVT